MGGVDDLLILGPDREPSPWRRRLAVVAVLIVAAVVIITHLPGKRDAPSRHLVVPSRHLIVRVSVSAGPVQLAGLGSSAASLLNHSNGITGPATSPSPAGSRHSSQRHSSQRHCTGHRGRRRCTRLVQRVLHW
jgi:hypothetical protein